MTPSSLFTPPTRRVQNFYAKNNGWRMFDARYLTEEMEHYLDEEEIALQRALEGKGYTHFIEVGCGYGRYLNWAAFQGLNYDGVDLVDWLADMGKGRCRDVKSRMPLFHCEIHNLPASSIPQLFNATPLAPLRERTLTFFPFNCFGNIADFEATLEALSRVDTDIFISTFQQTDYATDQRVKYYGRCGYTGMERGETDKGMLVTSVEGLRSIAYTNEELDRLLARYGFDTMSVVEFGGIGVGHYFRKR